VISPWAIGGQPDIVALQGVDNQPSADQQKYQPGRSQQASYGSHRNGYPDGDFVEFGSCVQIFPRLLEMDSFSKLVFYIPIDHERLLTLVHRNGGKQWAETKIANRMNRLASGISNLLV